MPSRRKPGAPCCECAPEESSSSCSVITVTVTVTDAETGLPIEGADVEIHPADGLDSISSGSSPVASGVTTGVGEAKLAWPVGADDDYVVAVSKRCYEVGGGPEHLDCGPNTVQVQLDPDGTCDENQDACEECDASEMHPMFIDWTLPIRSGLGPWSGQTVTLSRAGRYLGYEACLSDGTSWLVLGVFNCKSVGVFVDRCLISVGFGAFTNDDCTGGNPFQDTGVPQGELPECRFDLDDVPFWNPGSGLSMGTVHL